MHLFFKLEDALADHIRHSNHALNINEEKQGKEWT
jgi:hypothetical protein